MALTLEQARITNELLDFVLSYFGRVSDKIKIQTDLCFNIRSDIVVSPWVRVFSNNFFVGLKFFFSFLGSSKKWPPSPASRKLLI